MTPEERKKEEDKRVKAKKQAELDARYSKVLTPQGFKDMNKTDFKKQFAGKLPFDLNNAWDWIQKNKNKKD